MLPIGEHILSFNSSHILNGETDCIVEKLVYRYKYGHTKDVCSFKLMVLLKIEIHCSKYLKEHYMFCH